MRVLGLIVLLMPACTPTGGPPAWAVDPIWIEPTDEGGIQGFQSWELFDAGWSKGYSERHYLCAVVVRISGNPSSREDCTNAWDITTRILETDCDNVDPNEFLGLEALAFIATNATAEEEAPYPGQSAIIRADYGQGWEPYGWGWPSALDQGIASTSDGTFSGTEPFQLRPTLLWDLSL